MIDYVVGIDPSLTSTGLAAIWRHGGVQVASFGRTGHLDEPLPMRHRRIADLTNQVRDWLPRGRVLVVIEGPAYGATGGSAHDRSGLWWRLVAVALNRELPVAVVGQATRAKYATGNGRASKADVHAAVVRHLLVVPGNFDEADAAVLAWMGAHWLGWRTDPTPQQTASLASARWPDVPDLERTTTSA